MSHQESLNANDESSEANMSSSSSSRQSKPLWISVNQDMDHMVIGTTLGLRILSLQPVRVVSKKEPGGGSIGIVEMLHKTNVLAFVGGNNNLMFPKTKAMLWDDSRNTCIGEFSLKSEVLALKLRKDMIVVVLEKKISVYSLRDLSSIDRITTSTNPQGLCALSSSMDNCVLACPHIEVGQVLIRRYVSGAQASSINIAAHESELQILTLDPSGKYLATASKKGTVIRIFDTNDGTCIHELRRGMKPAIIHCLTFDAAAKYVALSSDRGTVHVFKLGDTQSTGGSDTVDSESAETPPAIAEPKQSSFSIPALTGFISQTLVNLPMVPKSITSSLQQTRSFAQYQIPSETRVLCAFYPAGSISMIGMSARIWKQPLSSTGEKILSPEDGESFEEIL